MGRQRQRQREKRRQQQESNPSRVSKSAPSPPTAGMSRVNMVVGGLVVLVALIAFGYFALHNGKKQTASGQQTTPGTPSIHPTAVPGVRSGSTSKAAAAQSVDGVGCLGSEQLTYHIHQYLELFDHGVQIQVPALVGIPTTIQNGQQSVKCFYWIHVHPGTGNTNIIHVESPKAKTFVLGDFFDIWAKTAATTSPPGDAYVTSLRAAAAKGNVTAYYNGKLWHGGYRSIPLKSHAVIAVEIGRPLVAPKPFTNWNGL